MNEEQTYGKVYRFGACRTHKEMWGEHVSVEEKIDGSQFSFWLGEGREPVFASRNRILPRDEEGQFSGACDHLRERAEAMAPGIIYRGECLAKPKANRVAYDRVPKGNVVLWSVEENGVHISHGSMALFAAGLGLDVTPLISGFRLNDLNDLRALVDGPALLGGKREGIVIKRGNIRAKMVSEKFQELSASRRLDRSGPEKWVRSLGASQVTPARMEKAVDFLRLSGKLTGTRADIGPIVKRIAEDVLEEETEMLVEELLEHFWPSIARGTSEGVAAWYTKKLEDESCLQPPSEEEN